MKKILRIVIAVILLLSNYLLCNELLTNTSKNIFQINFKSYEIKSLNSEANSLFEWSYNQIYSSLNLGLNKKSLYILLSENNFGFYLIKSKCPLISEYQIENSPTFNQTSSIIIAYKQFNNAIKITDIVYLNDIMNESVQIDNYQSVYSSSISINQTKNYFLDIYDQNINITNYQNITFGILGLELQPSYRYEFIDNLFVFLKKNNYSSSYFWSIKYSKKNNNEGSLIIGEKPKCYNEKCNEGEYYNEIEGIKISLGLKWGFVFRRIYFEVTNKNKKLINDIYDSKALIYFNYGLITGSTNYYEKIKENYFDYYINKSICFQNLTKTKISSSTLYFYCEANLFKESDLKKFPSLFFQHNELNYTFELNYEDLFRVDEKNNKAYFLILFYNYKNDIWELGKIFLKKYELFFNHDSKTIGFYFINNKKEKNGNHSSNKSMIVKQILLILFLIAIISVLFIILFKKLSNRERKLRPNEISYKIKKFDTGNKEFEDLDNDYEGLKNGINNNSTDISNEF